MPLYEHVFLARQDVSNTQVEALTKEYTDVIEAGGGKITKSEYWGIKSLAYKIKKSRKAHFSLMNIDAPPAAVAEMERLMGLSTEVLRFITIRSINETELSAMMRKSDRDDRGTASRRLRRPWRVGSAVAVAAVSAVTARVGCGGYRGWRWWWRRSRRPAFRPRP
jgi:small subunit ribosomal protein S6